MLRFSRQLASASLRTSFSPAALSRSFLSTTSINSTTTVQGNDSPSHATYLVIVDKIPAFSETPFTTQDIEDQYTRILDSAQDQEQQHATVSYCGM